MDLTTKITQKYSTMTHSERKLADFILRNTEEALTMNTHSLADAVNISSATVIRFVRTIGFDSFAAMRVALAISARSCAEAAHPTPDPHFSQDYAELQLSDTIISSVLKTRNLQTRDTLERAAQAVNAANCLYLYGVGTSGTAADSFQHKMVNIGKPCMYYQDGALSVSGTAHSMKGEAALGISYSGRNRDVLFAMETCHKNGAVTIGITQASSPLTKHLDILLPIPYVEDGLCDGANLSIYAQLTALDLLYLSILNIARKDKEKRLTESKQTARLHAAR